MNIDQLKYNLTNNVGLQAVIATLIAASGAVKTALTTLITTTMSTVSANVTALMAGTYGGVQKVTTLTGADAPTSTITSAMMSGGVIFASKAGTGTYTLAAITAADIGKRFTIVKTGSAGALTLKYAATDNSGATISAACTAQFDAITLVVTALATVKVVSENYNTAVAQTQEALTDNSGGTAATTIAVIGETYSQSEVANAIKSITAQLAKVKTTTDAIIARLNS